jgi:lipoprotein NlpI
LYLRAQLFERTRQFAPAELDLNRLLELSPSDPALLLQRGVLRLRMADFTGSVADLDRYGELRSSQVPQLWQRGIALFYAGRFEDARRQFELHRTVNPHDVENSAWHFACLARTDGFEAARARWMPVQGDQRVPMRQIQELMTGKGTPEAVLQAVETLRQHPRYGLARMYAHLYLALYHGAEGRRELEAKHATEAARDAVPHGIMGDIAQLHSEWVAEEIQKARP